MIQPWVATFADEPDEPIICFQKEQLNNGAWVLLVLDEQERMCKFRMVGFGLGGMILGSSITLALGLIALTWL